MPILGNMRLALNKGPITLNILLHDLLSIHILNGCQGLLMCGKLDQCVAFDVACAMIQGHLEVFYRAKISKFVE